MRALLFLAVGCTDWFGGGGDTAPVDSADADTDVDTDTDADTDAAALAADDARVRALEDLPGGEFPCRTALLVRVKHIVDGDTAYVQPDEGGDQLKVRFIGVDTPEVAHDADPAECYGEEAMAYSSEALLDRLAWLTFDAECTDVYGRSLAYVIRGDGDEGFHNRVLARNGYASALAIEPNTTFETEIDRDVAQAKVEGLGMWEGCP